MATRDDDYFASSSFPHRQTVQDANEPPPSYSEVMEGERKTGSITANVNDNAAMALNAGFPGDHLEPTAPPDEDEGDCEEGIPFFPGVHVAPLNNDSRDIHDRAQQTRPDTIPPKKSPPKEIPGPLGNPHPQHYNAPLHAQQTMLTFSPDCEKGLITTLALRNGAQHHLSFDDRSYSTSSSLGSLQSFNGCCNCKRKAKIVCTLIGIVCACITFFVFLMQFLAQKN
ncbi:uncharacterized protein LOC106180246 [Lingula anatina]|uniref:Uncharacterized protein LOC106180246 n=1 Tax=Lingula anatina TaxID=7574 RepID=A0A1S3KBK4_LINAN|nr:uncharacterized protein LOC106180246 [Lingula anatina]|eukprot:XP_013419636.1 uncharacterized protein LOC106180246 [Lingula anatina]